MTALDKCPLLGLFATASKDGYIKVFRMQNHTEKSYFSICSTVKLT